MTATVAQGHFCEGGTGPRHGYARSVGAVVTVQGANRGGGTDGAHGCGGSGGAREEMRK